MSKRIRFRLFGKRISMSEEEWEQLKQRFDAKNAVSVSLDTRPYLKCVPQSNFFEIHIECSWCVKTLPGIGGCKNCMWHKFKDRCDPAPGCLMALARVLKDRYGVESFFVLSGVLPLYPTCFLLGGVFAISGGIIRWTRGADAEARKILWCIQNELKAIEVRRKK